MAEYEKGEKSLREITARHAVKHTTFLGWVVDNHDNLADLYMRAQRIRAINMRDEILPILDDGRNDWMERTTRSGDTFMVLNSEHIRRSEARAGYRERFAENMLTRALGGKADATDLGTIHVHIDEADAEI